MAWSTAPGASRCSNASRRWVRYPSPSHLKTASPTRARHASTAFPTVTATSARNSPRSEEHTSELQSQSNLVCRLLLEKKQQIHAAGGAYDQVRRHWWKCGGMLVDLLEREHRRPFESSCLQGNADRDALACARRRRHCR